MIFVAHITEKDQYAKYIKNSYKFLRNNRYDKRLHTYKKNIFNGNSDNTKCWRRSVEMEKSHLLLVSLQIESKNRTIYSPSSPKMFQNALQPFSILCEFSDHFILFLLKLILFIWVVFLLLTGYTTILLWIMLLTAPRDKCTLQH